MKTTAKQRLQWGAYPVDLSRWDSVQAIVALVADVEELQAIVNKLPKDAENNPCIPGDERYHPDEAGIGIVRFADWEDKGDLAEGVEFVYEGNICSFRPINECCSFEEAARKEQS